MKRTYYLSPDEAQAVLCQHVVDREKGMKRGTKASCSMSLDLKNGQADRFVIVVNWDD